MAAGEGERVAWVGAEGELQKRRTGALIIQYAQQIFMTVG